jgi:hypothetical protein
VQPDFEDRGGPKRIDLGLAVDIFDFGAYAADVPLWEHWCQKQTSPSDHLGGAQTDG